MSELKILGRRNLADLIDKIYIPALKSPARPGVTTGKTTYCIPWSEVVNLTVHKCNITYRDSKGYNGNANTLIRFNWERGDVIETISVYFHSQSLDKDIRHTNRNKTGYRLPVYVTIESNWAMRNFHTKWDGEGDGMGVLYLKDMSPDLFDTFDPYFIISRTRASKQNSNIIFTETNQTNTNTNMATNSNRNSMFNISNIFKGAFGRVSNGLFRMTLDGSVAVRIDSQDCYKTVNPVTGEFQNVDNFAIDPGADTFFIVPTQKLAVGDIVMVNGTPRCVLGVQGNEVTVVNYGTSVKETLLLEKHIFLGQSFYGKLMSPLMDFFKGFTSPTGTGNSLASTLSTNPLMFMLMCSHDGNGFGDMNGMLPLLLLGQGGGNIDPMALMLMMGGNKMEGMLPMLLLSQMGKNAQAQAPAQA